MVRIYGDHIKFYKTYNDGVNTAAREIQWLDKYLLEEEIESFLEKEFVFAVNFCVRGSHFFKSFWYSPVGSILSAKHEDELQSLVHD